MIFAADLRRLAEHARRGGADLRWLEGVMAQIIGQQLCVDPRRLEALSLRRWVKQADKELRRAGVTGRVRILAERFNRSRSTIHAMLEEQE